MIYYVNSILVSKYCIRNILLALCTSILTSAALKSVASCHDFVLDSREHCVVVASAARAASDLGVYVLGGTLSFIYRYIAPAGINTENVRENRTSPRALIKILTRLINIYTLCEMVVFV